MQTKDTFLWMILAWTINSRILFVSLCGGWILSYSEPFLWFPHKVHSLLCAFLYKQDRGDGTQLAPFSEGQFPGAGRWDCQTVCAAATPKETQVRQCTHMYKQHSISEILHLCQGCPHTYIYMHCVTLLGPLLIMHETVMYTHTHTHTHIYIYIYTHTQHSISEILHLCQGCPQMSIVLGPLLTMHKTVMYTPMYTQHSISEIRYLCQGCPHTSILWGPLLTVHEAVMYTYVSTMQGASICIKAVHTHPLFEGFFSQRMKQ